MAGPDKASTKHVCPKAERSIHSAAAWFLNASSRNVGVYWLGYDGCPVLYSTLTPGTHFKIRTYVGHPWIAADKQTHERMLIKNEFIYYPRAIERPFNPGCDATKWVAKITLPLFTLRSSCMQVVIRQLLEFNKKVEDLEIPKTLKNELIHVIALHSQDFKELYKKNNGLGLPST